MFIAFGSVFDLGLVLIRDLLLSEKVDSFSVIVQLFACL